MDWFEEHEELKERDEDRVYGEWRDAMAHLPKNVQDFVRTMSFREGNVAALEMGEEVSKFDNVVFNYVKSLIFEEGLSPYAAIDEGSSLQATFKDARAFAATNPFAVRM